MIDLLLAAVHTEFVEGTKTGLKCVSCAGCGRDYFYTLTVTATAGANTVALIGDKAAASATAAERAEAKLARKFARRDDPVPCPHCGRLQDNMLAGLRKKYGEPAKNWAATAIAFAVLGGLAASVWLAIGLNEKSNGHLIAGGVFAAVSLAGVVASYFTVRRLRRIRRADGTDDRFRDDVRDGRRKLLPVAAVLPVLRQWLAEATEFDERVRLRGILERLAAEVPPAEWDAPPAPAAPPKPWKRTGG